MTLWSEHPEQPLVPRNEREVEAILSKWKAVEAAKRGLLTPDDLAIQETRELCTLRMQQAADNLNRLLRPRSKWREYDNPELLLRSAIVASIQALALFRRLDELELTVLRSSDQDQTYQDCDGVIASF